METSDCGETRMLGNKSSTAEMARIEQGGGKWGIAVRTVN